MTTTSLLVTSIDGRSMDADMKLSEGRYLFYNFMPARFAALFQRAAEALAMVEIVARGHGVWLRGTNKRVMIVTHETSGERMDPPLLVTVSETGETAERHIAPRRGADP